MDAATWRLTEGTEGEDCCIEALLGTQPASREWILAYTRRVADRAGKQAVQDMLDDIDARLAKKKA